MKRGASFAARSNRIEEDPEVFDTSSSEDELIPLNLPLAKSRSQAPGQTSSHPSLFDAELGNGGASGHGSEGEEYDDELEEGLLDEDYAGTNDKEEAIRERLAHTQEQMKLMMSLLDEDQLQRYETFRRVAFSRPAIKKLIVRVLDQQVNQNSVIIIAGIAKVFVGELVEEARRVMESQLEEGPIQPSHLLEAHRRLKTAGLASGSTLYKRPINRLL